MGSFDWFAWVHQSVRLVHAADRSLERRLRRRSASNDVGTRVALRLVETSGRRWSAVPLIGPHGRIGPSDWSMPGRWLRSVPLSGPRGRVGPCDWSVHREVFTAAAAAAPAVVLLDE
eukprot:4660434-Pyramimonas_sp.AAC.1